MYASGTVTHYGRLKVLDNETDATGTVEIDPGINLDGKTLYVFNEQYNGGENDDTKLTDFASELFDVSNTVNAYEVKHSLTGLSSDGAVL